MKEKKSVIYTYKILKDIFDIGISTKSEKIDINYEVKGIEIEVKNHFLEILKGIEYLNDGHHIYLEGIDLTEAEGKENPIIDIYMGNLCDFLFYGKIENDELNKLNRWAEEPC